MMNKQILTVLLLANLALLSFATGTLVTGSAGLLSETLLVTFLVTSFLLFYGVSIQNTMRIELTSFMVGFVANLVFSLSGLFARGSLALSGILGGLCALVLAVNVMAVYHGKTAKKVAPKIEEEEFAPTSFVPATLTTKSVTPITEMLHQVQMHTPTPNTNVVNVKIDAPKSNFDESRLLLKDLELKDSIEKVDEKLENTDKKIEDRIQKVKQTITTEFDDMKKEIDELKEKQKMFIVSKNGKKMHSPSCMVAARIPSEIRVVLNDYEDAVKKGYQACAVCLPTE